MWYKPSPATEEEDSYAYRVEWDDYIEWGAGTTFIHHGPGARDVSGYDNAWDFYEARKSNPDYVYVRLIRIHPDGTETTCGA